jgi:hypothetical protein
MEQDLQEHYASPSKIPEISEATPLLELYGILTSLGSRGFVATRSGRPTVYIDSVELGNSALQSNFSFTGTIANALETLRPHVIQIEEKPVKVHEDWRTLRSRGDEAVARLEMPNLTGWFLNHEFVFQTSVGKPVFVCSNGHPNSSPDHGYCSACPAKLIKTESAPQ